MRTYQVHNWGSYIQTRNCAGSLSYYPHYYRYDLKKEDRKGILLFSFFFFWWGGVWGVGKGNLIQIKQSTSHSSAS